MASGQVSHSERQKDSQNHPKGQSIFTNFARAFLSPLASMNEKIVWDHVWQMERHALRIYGFEYAVILFGIGIVTYFRLPFEPNLKSVGSFLIILGLCLWGLSARRNRAYLNMEEPLNMPATEATTKAGTGPSLGIRAGLSFGFAIFFISLGLFRATWHSYAVNAPIPLVSGLSLKMSPVGLKPLSFLVGAYVCVCVWRM